MSELCSLVTPECRASFLCPLVKSLTHIVTQEVTSQNMYMQNACGPYTIQYVILNDSCSFCICAAGSALHSPNAYVHCDNYDKADSDPGREG